MADATDGRVTLGADEHGAADAGPKPSGAMPSRVLLHTPVDVRSASLAVLAVVASIYAMQWAKSLLIPILLGVMASYALAPLVDRLERWRVPRVLGAGLVLTSLVSVLAYGVWTLSDQANALVETLPQVTQKLRQLSQGSLGSASAIAKVRQAARELERAADDGAGRAGPVQADPASVPQRTRRDAAAVAAAATVTSVEGTGPGSPVVTRVVVEPTRFDVRDYLLTGTLGAFAFLGQAAIVLLITLFLLASGNTFRRKMVKLAGPKLSQKKVTVQALDEINEQIQRYLLVQVAMSVMMGTATGLAFYIIGLQQAAVWGVVAAVTSLIPYLGAAVVGAGAALVAFIQFGTIEMALLVAASSFGVRAVIGNLVGPWLTGRASRMSPFAVFVGVLSFGWLWGVWGLLLGVPILMVVKSICDRVEDLKPIGELLGA